MKITLHREETDTDLIETCILAVAALEEENARLRGAFLGASPGLRRFYEATPLASGGTARTSEGLAYWLYETTLVYLIFRAWVPRVPVVWDHDRGSERGAVDLVVRSQDDHAVVRWAFEAKWWLDSTVLPSMREDASKLRALESGRRFLVAFWHCPTPSYHVEDNEVVRVARDEGWTRVLSGTFECNVRGDNDHLFVLDVLEVGA